MEARDIDHRNVDASVGIGQLLSAQDPLSAVEEMAKFPDPEGCGNPEGTYGKATFDDSFVHVEIARTLIKYATDTKDKALLESEQVLVSPCAGWMGRHTAIHTRPSALSLTRILPRPARAGGEIVEYCREGDGVGGSRQVGRNLGQPGEVGYAQAHLPGV